jgi:SH3-like domain-containing protein
MRILALILLLVTGSLPVFAQNFCVMKSGASLRRTPSTSGPLAWKAPKYMPLQGTGKSQSGWVEVKDVDGDVSWISGNDVSSKVMCLVVQARMTRARTGPGRQFQSSTIGLVEKYAAFKELGGEEGWTEVESDEGEKGWVNIDHMWKPTRKMRMSFE